MVSVPATIIQSDCLCGWGMGEVKLWSPLIISTLMGQKKVYILAGFLVFRGYNLCFFGKEKVPILVGLLTSGVNFA